MLWSGATTGEAEAWSDKMPAPSVFCVGSTPVVQRVRQPPGGPFGGNRMLQPSSSSPCSEADHCKLKSAVFTATRYAPRPQKCPRLAVYNVEPSAEIAGARFSTGRCNPQGTLRGTASLLGGQGKGDPLNVPKHFVGAPGSSAA